ncbi:hypothetical protein PYW07_007816 [Mythimna separata]|uniref:Uncharacterized protein n=1 Tax=Mythimna separata TaxID=271217 RepID=A0AAD7YP24_MYTSE|nr:hypothetical protein PYW07_007816 [Mythimna separata]
MYSNMCLKIAVCLALFAFVNSHVIKNQEVPLSPDGMVLEITVKNKGDGQVVSAMKIDINEKDKKVVMSMGEPVHVNTGETTTEFLPSIENRHITKVGSCPLGYTRRGGFCFPDDDY